MDIIITRFNGAITIVQDITSLLNLIFADASKDHLPDDQAIIRIECNKIVIECDTDKGQENIYDLTDCCFSCAEKCIKHSLGMDYRE